MFEYDYSLRISPKMCFGASRGVLKNVIFMLFVISTVSLRGVDDSAV